MRMVVVTESFLREKSFRSQVPSKNENFKSKFLLDHGVAIQLK